MSRAEVPTNPERDEFIRQIASRLRRRGWGEPALIALQAGQPLTVVAAQLMFLAQPVLALVWPYAEIGRLAELLEDRNAVENLMEFLETG